MRILLVSPPISLGSDITPSFDNPPLGLAYIASVLEMNNFEVKILDAHAYGLGKEGILGELKVFKPDILGISIVTPRIRQALELCEFVKKYDSDIKTLVGGPHVTALPEDTIKHRSIDYAACGEGEYTTLELIRALMDQEKLENVDGILFKKNGKIVKTRPRALVKNLDDLPRPAYHLLPMRKYNPLQFWPERKQGGFSTMIASRGCPFNCIYCDVKLTFGRTYRCHSPEYVVNEIEYLGDKFNVFNICFRDSIFTLNKKRVEKICELILERGLDISWFCNSRVNFADEKVMKLLKKAGCWMIQYGVETGDPEILKKAQRGTTVRQIEDAINLTKKIGIQVQGFFMMGLPGETKETIERTVEFALKLDLDYAGFSIATPYPGTAFYEWAKENNYLTTDNWDDFVFNRPIVETPYLSMEDLKNAQERALRRFYLRPKFIIRQLINTRSLALLKMNLKYVKFLFGKKSEIYRQ